MNFRLVPNSVTLNDLERRNSPNRRVILPSSVAFEAHYVKVVEYTSTFCSGNLVFSLWRNWQVITPSESVKLRHSALASENMTNNQP